MYENSLRILKKQGIILEDGLNNEEINQAEATYDLKFPNCLKELLMMVLPVSKGFYNWRDFTEDNIKNIKDAINRPQTDLYDMASEVYWCDDWGGEPDEKASIEEIRKRLEKAPKLVPIYTHRYMPMLNIERIPIISIHGVDIIYYGKNLIDYMEIEFGGKEQDAIDYGDVEYIPFWSDLM